MSGNHTPGVIDEFQMDLFDPIFLQEVLKSDDRSI